MRVLYFTRDYTTHDHRFLSALANTDHDVFALRLERRGMQREDRPLPAAIHQIAWEGGERAVERNEYARMSRNLKQIVAEIQPDVIHAGSIQTAALIAAMAKLNPLVSMSWGYDMLMDAESTPQMRRDTLKTLMSSSIVICDCDTVRRQLLHFGFPENRIVQFPWGVDLAHYHPNDRLSERNKLGWSEKDFILLSGRAWEPIYDVTTIVKAFTLAVQAVPEMRLILLGGGSLENELRNLLEQAGVIGLVSFYGRVDNEQLPGFYRAADLYVSASLTDGSSVSLMENMACGTPALLSDIPSNREWVAEGNEGWFFPVGDVDTLAQKMVFAYTNRALLKEMGKNAHKKAETSADWRKNFQQLLVAYELAVRSKEDLG